MYQWRRKSQSPKATIFILSYAFLALSVRHIEDFVACFVFDNLLACSLGEKLSFKYSTSNFIWAINWCKWMVLLKEQGNLTHKISCCYLWIGIFFDFLYLENNDVLKSTTYSCCRLLLRHPVFPGYKEQSLLMQNLVSAQITSNLDCLPPPARARAHTHDAGT